MLSYHTCLINARDLRRVTFSRVVIVLARPSFRRAREGICRWERVLLRHYRCLYALQALHLGSSSHATVWRHVGIMHALLWSSKIIDSTEGGAQCRPKSYATGVR
jgi:hypothetical protein